MKILHVIPHYFPSINFGGTPVSCHYLSYNLALLGNEVDVLTTDVFSADNRYYKKVEKKGNYNIFRFKNISNSLAYKNRFVTPIPNSYFIFKKLSNYDIVQLHEYRNLLNVMMCLAKPFIRAKFILYPLGTYPIFNTQNKFKKAFDFLFAKIINNSIDKYVVVSEMEKRSLISSGVPAHKIKKIYYGVDVIERRFNKQKPFNWKFQYILYIGRIDKRKGVHHLIKAYAKSAISKKNIHLVIAGNGNDYLKLCKKIVNNLKINKYVHFLKPVGGRKKSTLYHHANLVVYITDKEAYGLVPMEGAICGTASLYSKTAGVAEILRKYKIGEGVNYKDNKTLAKKIKKLGPQKNKVTTEKINQLLIEYSWFSVAKKFERLYGYVKKN